MVENNLKALQSKIGTQGLKDLQDYIRIEVQALVRQMLNEDDEASLKTKSVIKYFDKLNRDIECLVSPRNPPTKSPLKV